ncbi:MAG: ribonuclease HII [Erysipelotrichaceae bacterium]|nr:ribonuclease HII [Erysipelotrichaceae bacterium]
MNDMLCYERDYWQKQEEVIGIDEAGRGPLAGPLLVAGVILPIGFFHPDIIDSKKLSSKKRELLYKIICNEAIAFYINIIDPKIIDDLNIYQATKRAMNDIAELLPATNVLVDAMPLACDKNVLSIIKGDDKSISIAAASILAKVERDRIMYEYDNLYPEYDFKSNKGYPTKKHVAALQQYGYTPIHRLTYNPVFNSKRIKY